MDVRLRVLPLLAVAVVAATVALASAGAPPRGEAVSVATTAKKKPRKVPVTRSPHLWATINVCDTPAQPDTIGIRGSMPGWRSSAKLLMRFQVQYLARADGRWHDVTANADSGWKPVGRMKGRVVESGQNFTFRPPSGGGAHHLRGVVRFKWVRKGRVVARARRVTEAGHRSTAGADPVGYSAAVCDIT